MLRRAGVTWCHLSDSHPAGKRNESSQLTSKKKKKSKSVLMCAGCEMATEQTGYISVLFGAEHLLLGVGGCRLSDSHSLLSETYALRTQVN